MARSVFLYYEDTGARDRDEIEEAIVEALGSRGAVTGAGTGLGLVNLDIELTSEDPQDTLRSVDHVVAQMALPGAFWQWEHDDSKIPVGTL